MNLTELKDALGNKIDPVTVAPAVKMSDEATTTVADTLEELQMDSGSIEFASNHITKTFESGSSQEILFVGNVITEVYKEPGGDVRKTKTTTINADGSITIETTYAED